MNIKVDCLVGILQEVITSAKKKLTMLYSITEVT